MAVCWISARTCSLLCRPFQKTDLAGEWLGIGLLESLYLVFRPDDASLGNCPAGRSCAAARSR
jgi:hypothetical protein